MLSYKSIFERLQWGYKFNLKEKDNLLSASCFSKNGYVFIHFHQNKLRPQLSSVNVTIYDRRYNTESRLNANGGNYHEIKRQINNILG